MTCITSTENGRESAAWTVFKYDAKVLHIFMHIFKCNITKSHNFCGLVEEVLWSYSFICSGITPSSTLGTTCEAGVRIQVRLFPKVLKVLPEPNQSQEDVRKCFLQGRGDHTLHITCLWPVHFNFP